MLEIKNLNVEIDGKGILKNINLKLEKGKVYALKGRNGSGKTSLVNAIMGNPKYRIISGEILIDGVNIEGLPANKRARKGLFVSYQNPVEVPGVDISNFLRTAFNSLKEEKVSLLEFRRLLEEKADELGINKNLLGRYLNEGFSGGEKKQMEILQMLVLNPSIAILDETDSGLDSESLNNFSNSLKKFVSKDKIVLIISHYHEILNYLNPKKVFVMEKGKITEEIKEGVNKIIR